MNGRTGGGRGPQCGGALAVVAAVAVLAAGCGVVHVHFGSGGSAQAGPGAYRAEVAYAQCMRAHGVPGFPIPNPSENVRISGPPGGNPHSPAARANDACEHLLLPGSTGTGGGTGQLEARS
jgi:hypothetical protein